ncbi:hypothetical protein MKZ07_04400 [Paenibacillus sp. FSL P4-0338]|uniref:hypothetical protein n=1 Tax=Paenibacillus sp. FSL P4-0338 TaxID=2921635 RepID=UPI0030F5A856
MNDHYNKHVSATADQPRVPLASSFADAMHQVLSAKGWFTLSKPMLAGMTALCFRLSVHRQLHPDSATAYNWAAEHFVAADLIGIIASQGAGFNFSPTFPLYQKQAITAIRQSLEQGTGVVCWKDRFVVITRYDDERQLFYYKESDAAAELELPYDQLGRNESPYWYGQIYEGQVQKDTLQVIRESFIQAVYKAEVHDLMLPESQYACGLKAYDAVLVALADKSYDAAGAYETLVFYAGMKQDTAAYAREASLYWPELEGIAEHYTALAAVYNEITDALNERPVQAPEAPCSIDAESLLPLLREAKRIETAAIQSIRLLLREPIENRFHDVGLR